MVVEILRTRSDVICVQVCEESYRDVHTNIHLKEIIDVFVENDPGKKERDKSLFSVGRTGKASEGFNF